MIGDAPGSPRSGPLWCNFTPTQRWTRYTCLAVSTMSSRGRCVISARWRPCWTSSPMYSPRVRRWVKRRREMQPARFFLGGDTMRQAMTHTVAAGVRLLHERAILVLLLLFCLDLGCMLLSVSVWQSYAIH